MPRCAMPLRIGEDVVHLGDVADEPANDEEGPGPDFSLQLKGTGHPRARGEVLFHLLEQWFELLEVMTLIAAGNLFRSPLFLSRPNMPELGDIRAVSKVRQLGGQIVHVEFHLVNCNRGRLIQQAMLIEGCQKVPAVLLCTQAIEADGIQPLEDVAPLTMLRHAAVLLIEAHDILEARDDPFLLGRVGCLLLRCRSEIGKFACQFVEIIFTHSGLPRGSA